MKRKQIGKKMVSLLLIAALMLTVQRIPVLAETGETAENAEEVKDLPSNPVHHCTMDDADDYGENDTTDWSYVYFGSYPQTEVTENELTSAITRASYDVNGDAWVNGMSYRRISKSDTNDDYYFGDSTYRYFKWERIKWRVLKVNGSTMFVAADEGLDCKDYNEEYTSVTWENCTLRSWLNNDFYGTAFSDSERGAIVSQIVVNEDNPYTNIEGGNNTTDKVYLLSLSEVMNPDYGFCKDYSTHSVSRRIKASDYAHARGANVTSSNSGYAGGCFWWLRSPADNTDAVSVVAPSGGISGFGHAVNYNNNEVCVPVLHIDLSSNLWSLVDDETSGEGDGDTDDDIETIEDFKTEKTITINSGGTAYARFYLCDKNKKLLKNISFNYYVVKDGSDYRYEYCDKQTDENGGYIFPTMPISGNTSSDFKYVISLQDASEELYTDTYTIHVVSTHLEYTEEWNLSFGGQFTGSGSIGCGSLSAEMDKTYEKIIKLKHKADGEKDLELSVKATADKGIKLAGNLLNWKSDDSGANLKIADSSISGKNKNNTKWTLLIPNYDENSEEDQTLVDDYLTILLALFNSNNQMLVQALDYLDIDLKARSNGCSVEVGSDSSLAVVDTNIGSLYKITSKLFPAKSNTVYTYNSTEDYQKNLTEYEMGVSSESSLNLFSNSLLDSLGYSGFNMQGFEGLYKLDSSSVSINEEEIKLKSEDSEQKYDGLAGDKVSKVYTYTVSGKEADSLRNRNNNFKKLGEGKSGLLDVGQIRNMADEVLKCNEISYTEADKTKVKISGKLGGKLAEVFSIGVNFTGTRTTTVEVARGEKDKGGLYCTWKGTNDYEGVSGTYAITDLDTIIKPQSKRFFERLQNNIVSIVGDATDAVVQNVKAKIEQTKSRYLVTITMLKNASANLFSVENVGADLDNDLKKETKFVGNAYSVYVTDTEENEVASFNEEPILLELAYDEDDLQNVGLTLNEAELLHVGRYNADSNVYEDMGGILDEENQIVRLSITKPGQYALMVDKKTPDIASVTLSDATSQPTIEAYISDIGGISRIELWIDGNILIDAENYNEFYNPLTETLTYKVEDALTVGNHNIRLKAVDSSGNESEYFEKSFSVAGTPQIVEVNIPKNYQNCIDMNVLVEGYAIHCVEANVVETASNDTEESNVYSLSNIGENKWNLTLDNIDAKKCAIEIIVYDDAGNMVKSETYESVHSTTSKKPNTSGNQLSKNPNQNNNNTYVYRPDKVKLKTVKSNKKGQLQVKWKWIGLSNGYQIQYALNKKFTKGKRTKYADWLASNIVLKKLKSKKKYFVRIRACDTDSSGRIVYGPWSNIKKCKVK